jgi:hypothetical protein
VHPFNAANNINRVEALFPGWDNETDPSLHSLHNPAALAHQEAYVRKVIDTVNDLDNVLYEVINEGGSLAWQVHFVDFVHAYVRGKAKQHPVGITSGIPWFKNARIAASSVDWYSPINQPNWWDRSGFAYVEDYRADPPPADGRKVSLTDTDHLWGHGGNADWVWKSFARGHNPIFMDPWQGLYLGSTEDIAGWSFTGGVSKDARDYPDWEPTRQAMSDTRRYADKMNLAAALPHPELASSRYCLANPGEEYLVYLPVGGPVTVDLCAAGGQFAAEWFFPTIQRSMPGASVFSGGDYAATITPFTGPAVLYIKKV